MLNNKAQQRQDLAGFLGSTAKLETNIPSPRGSHPALRSITIVWRTSKAQGVSLLPVPSPVLFIYVCLFLLSCLLSTCPHFQRTKTLRSLLFPMAPDLITGPDTLQQFFLTGRLQSPFCLVTIPLVWKYHLEKTCWASLTNHQVPHSTTQKSRTGSQLSASTVIVLAEMLPPGMCSQCPRTDASPCQKTPGVFPPPQLTWHLWCYKLNASVQGENGKQIKWPLGSQVGSPSLSVEEVIFSCPWRW